MITPGSIIVSTQSAHHGIRFLVLRTLPGGGAKVRGIGPGPGGYRNRERYLTAAVLKQYKKEKR